MVALRYETLQQLVVEEFSKLEVPSGPIRREGVQQYTVRVPEYIAKDLQGLESLLREGQIQPAKASKLISDLCLETASFLYAAGAEHTIWRRWTSLTACGLLLTEQIYSAAQYAVLSGEWFLISQLPPVKLKSRQVSDQVLSQLMTGSSDSGLADEADDEYDDAWLQLLRSIPERDHPVTENALKVIADFWIGETEGDWRAFHPRSYPDFDTPSCVAAALARRQGFVPTSLSDEQYHFLEAGLAEAEPPSLIPEHFAVPVFEES